MNQNENLRELVKNNNNKSAINHVFSIAFNVIKHMTSIWRNTRQGLLNKGREI